jgi:hypothetical protein
MMLARFLVLLVAGTALTGCCVSGTGCVTGPTSGAPIAWDGLGEPPTANDAPGEERRPAKRKTARSLEIILGPLNASTPQSDAKAQYDNWEKRPNEDAEADARLARQTKICKGC